MKRKLSCCHFIRNQNESTSTIEPAPMTVKQAAVPVEVETDEGI